MNIIRKIFFAGACLMAAGCYYDSQQALYGVGTSQPCDTTNVTYTGKISAIINANCSSCHSQANASLHGNDIVLDTHDALKLQADKGLLMGDINQSPGFNPMPNNGSKLSDCDIARIQHWVDLNTPDN